MPSGILNRRRAAISPAAGGGLSYDATVLAAAGLTHYYKLNETSGTTATDSVGTTNGTASGSVTVNQSPIFSDATKSFAFSGGGNVGMAASRLVGSTSPWTIECEFNCTSIATAGAIWSIGNGGLTHYCCLTTLSNGHLSLTMFTGAGGDYTTITIANNTSYHCVATYDGTNITVYINGGVVNGGQEGAVAYNQASNSPGNAFLIGANGNGLNFGGRIAKVAIYNLVKSQSEITTDWLAVNNP